MPTPSLSMRDLIRRLGAVGQTASDPHVDEAVVVIEKLRISLTRFSGAEGFASLLRRALTLASADVSSLQSVKVGADGRLEGFARFAAEHGTDAAGEAEVAVAAHLLELLITFIGEPLTLKLVQGTWPEPTLRK